MTPTLLTPTYHCECGAKTEIPGKRIGDSLRCSCGQLRVITRAKSRGEVPPAVRSGGLSLADRQQVAATLRRIKLKRVGRATRHVALYPTWAVFLAGVQFYLAGILAGQNLIALGEERRGKRLQISGVVSYLLMGPGLLALSFTIKGPVAWSLILVVAAVVPLLFAIYYTSVQHAVCNAAREAGATNASVVMPLLLAVILGIAQAFAVWFLKIQIEGPW